ncbi:MULTISPECIES: LysR substrate-binding domain-containing protein [unclassified Leucobacter]|uniref:LysR substrate-binding domain-containing protein n=1 Tax=unclassified Leucobacter TaxID=2621730 RepID=UPI00165D6213|nr:MULTISPECIES: LysR substrate-binding domain-containing protein [unclassified Leucobacter]MBC9936232.1 LysR family transcriptional regulator [Leucobacter sp. cx-87]
MFPREEVAVSDVSLRQLELFAALPNFTTLSAAAAHLHISESALSQAVTAIERAVGEQLCVRRKARGLTLTPTGQQFAAQARQIVTDTRELLLGMGQGDELRGPVKLGCYSTFATSVVPELLEGFPQRHPGVQLEVMVGTNEELLSALEAGHLDVALLLDVSLPVGYRRRKIYATELEVHLHPEHPLASADTVDLSDLADEPFIQFYATPGTVNVIDAFAARGLEPKIAVSVSEIGLVEALVGRGLGYGLLMSRPNRLSTGPEGRPFVIRPLDPPVTITHMVGIWPEDMNLTPRASALLDFAVEKLGGFGRAGVSVTPDLPFDRANAASSS